jgi:hypothetical protein
MANETTHEFRIYQGQTQVTVKLDNKRTWVFRHNRGKVRRKMVRKFFKSVQGHFEEFVNGTNG